MAYQFMGAAKLWSGLSVPTDSSGIEAASQSWKMGAILVDSSGKLAVGAADPSLGTIVGVATGPATGTTNAIVTHTPALPSVVFEGNLDAGSGTYALLQSDMYARYGLAVSSGIFYIDQTDTTNIRVVIVGFKEPVGTQNARVYFTFLPNATRYSVTAV